MIDDFEEFDAWIKKQTDAYTLHTLALRGALRLVPIFISNLGGTWEGDGKPSLLALSYLVRAVTNLNQQGTAYVHSEGFSGEIFDLLHRFITTPAGLAFECIRYSNFEQIPFHFDDESAQVVYPLFNQRARAHSALSKPRDTLYFRDRSMETPEDWDKALYTDATLIQRGTLEIGQPLNPKWRSHRSHNSYYRKGITQFWNEWYQGFLDGKPLDWELQRRVALIPDQDWEKGPEHIARKIDEIKAEYLAEQLPLAEDLAFDQDSGTFHTTPREMAKPDLLGATLSQVEDALEDVMEAGSNGINERSIECRKLTRTFRKYGNDPQRIEMDFTTVHAGLTRQIISGELPPSEENLALQSALEEGAKAVRATHPEVAENRRILQEQSLRELTPHEKATLEEALPVLQAISDEALAEEWAQDIPALTNDSLLPVPDTAPRLPGADEATRIFGRAARMALETKKSANIIQRIDGHSGYKALRIVQVLEWLVQLGMRIFMYF